MRDMELNRRQHRRNAFRTIGYNPDQSRAFTSQVQGLGAEALLMSAPFYDGSLPALQAPDGTPYFMVDLDTVDNGNVIG